MSPVPKGGVPDWWYLADQLTSFAWLEEHWPEISDKFAGLRPQIRPDGEIWWAEGHFGSSEYRLDPKKKLAIYEGPILDFELSPVAGAFIAEVADLLPGYRLSVFEWNEAKDTSTRRRYGSVKELAKRVKKRDEIALNCARKRGEVGDPTRYRYQSLRHYSSLTFYHATRKSALESMKTHGLVTTGKAREITKTEQRDIGWTQLNFELKDAVYLTANPRYAAQIAKTLSDRYEEPGVIISVDGRDLDPARLTYDEDSIHIIQRDFSDYDYQACETGIPAYFTSLIDGSERYSVAYFGDLPWELLTVEGETRWRD